MSFMTLEGIRVVDGQNLLVVGYDDHLGSSRDTLFGTTSVTRAHSFGAALRIADPSIYGRVVGSKCCNCQCQQRQHKAKKEEFPHGESSPVNMRPGPQSNTIRRFRCRNHFKAGPFLR
jgi:hypothetical protein